MSWWLGWAAWRGVSSHRGFWQAVVLLLGSCPGFCLWNGNPVSEGLVATGPLIPAPHSQLMPMHNSVSKSLGCFGDSSRNLQRALGVLDVPLNSHLGPHVMFRDPACGCCQITFSSKWNCTWKGGYSASSTRQFWVEMPVFIYTAFKKWWLQLFVPPRGIGYVWLYSSKPWLKGPGSSILLLCKMISML